MCVTSTGEARLAVGYNTLPRVEAGCPLATSAQQVAVVLKRKERERHAQSRSRSLLPPPHRPASLLVLSTQVTAASCVHGITLT